jgi:RNA polymerase sigma-70 factor (ECF subfamily)
MDLMVQPEERRDASQADPAPSAASSVSWTEAIARSARTGDLSRFEELYGRVGPSLFAWSCLRIGPALRGRLESEDVVQETWCRALESFGNFDPARGTFRAWLFAIARNVLFESIRRVHRAAESGGAAAGRAPGLDELPDSVTSVTRRIARDDGVQRFLGRVAELGDDERELTIYCGLEGLGYAEAAARLGSTRGAVARRWQRLCAHLQQRGVPAELLAQVESS